MPNQTSLKVIIEIIIAKVFFFFCIIISPQDKITNLHTDTHQKNTIRKFIQFHAFK